MARLAGKVAIVTGAARGQGEATARLFAAEGARVVLTDQLVAPGAQVARDIGPAALFVEADVSNGDGWSRIVEATRAAFGRIDILINNAAIRGRSRLGDLSREKLERVLAVNLIAPILGMQAVIPHMVAQGGGSIVNISSVNGLRSVAGFTPYDASKWALRGATKSVALEFAARGVRVNSIHPGAIRTPMLDPDGTVDGPELAKLLRIASGRIGEPLEVANASLFLASDEASYVTGAELAVDGGWTAGLATEG